MEEFNIEFYIPKTQAERDIIVEELPKVDWDSYFMYRAFCMAAQSPDAQTKQGMVLVDTPSHRVITEGFNGFPPGVDDSALPRYRDDKYEYMVHCEPNAWGWAAKLGAHFDDVTIYSTMTPCETCVRNHITAVTNLKIKRLIYWEYRKFPAAEKILKLYPHIIMEQFEGGMERILESQVGHIPLQYMMCTPQHDRLDVGWTESYSVGTT